MMECSKCDLPLTPSTAVVTTEVDGWGEPEGVAVCQACYAGSPDTPRPDSVAE
jgi:hypothetical protein